MEVVLNVGIPYSWGNDSTIEEFADSKKTEVVIIDATRSTGKVMQRTVNVAELFDEGYEIYAKKPI